MAYINGAAMDVERVWFHGDRVVFKFKGVDSISDAERLEGAEVCIPKEQRLALPEGEYFESDLIGCEVVDPAGRILGAVEDLQECGGPPLLAVRTPEGRELLIPFAKSICVEIDVAAKRIRVELPEGLDNLDEAPAT